MNYNPMPELRVFGPMPYTRVDLFNALCLVLGKEHVDSGVRANKSLEALLGFARLIMYEEGLNPYKPSCRVVRQASIDFEDGKFNFQGESG